MLFLMFSSDDARTILAKALTSPKFYLRIYATKHMRVLLRAGVQDYFDWGIELLVKQLTDEHIKVAQLALTILDEACDEPQCMETLVGKAPSQQTLFGLGESGKQLWLR